MVAYYDQFWNLQVYFNRADARECIKRADSGIDEDLRVIQVKVTPLKSRGHTTPPKK